MTKEKKPSEMSSQELGEHFMENVIYSGDYPTIEATNLNLIAAITDEDHPVTYVLSFTGPDINTKEAGKCVNALLNETLLTKLVEEIAKAHVADWRFATTGEMTHLKRPKESWKEAVMIFERQVEEMHRAGIIDNKKAEQYLTGAGALAGFMAGLGYRVVPTK